MHIEFYLGNVLENANLEDHWEMGGNNIWEIDCEGGN
jgi:hypothetical protein